jgi:hypothetical protein
MSLDQATQTAIERSTGGPIHYIYRREDGQHVCNRTPVPLADVRDVVVGYASRGTFVRVQE